MGVLRFRLFGFPVDVQPGFWLLSLVIALGAGGAARTAILVAVILVSVLAHELGHALLARAHGEQPRITLHMLGGLTSWAPRREHGRLSSILITLAGPFAGLALAALSFGLLSLLPEDGGGHGRLALQFLVYANVFWGLVNLLPVLPFDGGQVLAAALGRERRRLAATISLVFGLIAAFVFYRWGLVLGAVFFVLGAVQSFFAARQVVRPAVPVETQRELLARGHAAIEAGEHEQAARFARAVLDVTSDVELARAAIELGAWAALQSGDVPRARAALRQLPRQLPPDPLLEGAVLEGDGDLPAAAARLLEARRQGDPRPELSAMLVRVLLAQQRLEEALRVTHEIFDDVSDEDVRRVAERGLEGGAVESARALLSRLAQRTEPAGS